MKAKDRHRITLLEYLGNPENGFPSRLELSVQVLGFKSQQHIYKVFTPEELSEIEREALDIRRTKYASRIAMVDQGLIVKAASGDAQAAKLVYQRFEGWSEKQLIEHSGGIDQLTDAELDNKLANLARKAGIDLAPGGEGETTEAE